MNLSKKIISFLLTLSLFIGSSHLKTQDSDQQTKETQEDEKNNKQAGKVNVGKDGKAYFTADWRNTELKDFLKGMSAIVKKKYPCR